MAGTWVRRPPSRRQGGARHGHGVKIDFPLAGEYRGDAKEKPVWFPDPQAASVPAASFRVRSLPRFVGLKLAAGMTAPHRLQDLADVLRLIEKAGLERNLAGELDPYIRAKYDELWLAAQHPAEDC